MKNVSFVELAGYLKQSAMFFHVFFVRKTFTRRGGYLVQKCQYKVENVKEGKVGGQKKPKTGHRSL